jgi:hypothetical protein
MSTREKLSIHEGEKLGMNDSTRYKSIMGAMQYLTLTSPDISFTVNKVCQFLHSATIVHWTTVKQILRYLKSCTGPAVKICRSNSMLVSAFSNANWAGYSDDRRSIRGYAVYLGSNLVSWSARKQLNHTFQVKYRVRI